MKYIKHPLWWVKYWYKWKLKRGIRIRYLKKKRNFAPRPYVKPKLTIYNTRYRGPYANSVEFDNSFDEIPEQMPIGGMVHISLPEDK